MILRKPYAFLIKHFKLIHTLLTICMFYLLFKSFKLHEFLNSTFDIEELTIERGSTEKLFNKGMFILPWIILVILAILLVVMIRKKKPKLFYFANIAIYIATIAVYNYLYSTILYMETNIASGRSTKLAIDISFMLTIIQLISTIISFIRSIGLDIKKFDFGKDLIELDVNEQDDEEFEINVDVDTNSMKRNFNKGFRYAKYFYIENMFIINTILLVIISSIGFTIYLNSGILNIKYTEGQVFATEDYSVNIVSSYITEKNTRGNKITNVNTKLLILNTQIDSYKMSNSINKAKTEILLDGKKYYPINKYSKDLLDLGTVYGNQTMNNGIINYLLVYEIPATKVKKQIIFRYFNDFKIKSKKLTPTYLSVKLNPLDLDIDADGTTADFKEKYVLNKNIISSSNMTLKSLDIDSYFINEYNYCFNIAECYDSIEYIRPNLNTNYDKYIMRVRGKYILDEQINNYQIKNLGDVIVKLGKIEYLKNNKKYTATNLTKISTKKYSDSEVFYIEIPKYVYDAESANLIIKLRNKEYKYVIF